MFVVVLYSFIFFFFFFQAEDGIRDTSVTGVQTCALPIYSPLMIQFSRVRWLSTFALICGCAFQARAQSAGSVEMYSEQGQRALAQGNYAEAEAAFEKLRELEPSMAEVHANLGAIYFQERKFGPATFALRQALKLKPALPKTAALLAMSLA